MAQSAAVQPQTQYAKSGDLHIAYQVVGDGPIDLVYLPDFVYSHVEFIWEEPAAARFLRRLASFARVILLDRRGLGLSDRPARRGCLEDQMDDVAAVMDAAGSNRAALLGCDDGGNLSALFAATHPERTNALILYCVRARVSRAPDYPWGWSHQEFDALCRTVERTWGTGSSLSVLAPSVAQDEHVRARWARFERLAVTPGAAIAQLRMLDELDMRHALTTIRVPTLVLRRAEELVLGADAARDLAGRIAGARYVETPGPDHLIYFGDADAIAQEVEEFLTGARASEPDRVLASVLFTEIVRSTDLARELGDRRWRELLDAHDALATRQLERFRGRLIKTTGEGFLATFEGPVRAIQCAVGIRDGVRALGIEVRAGLHTGELGFRGGDIGGIAVHIGARVAALAAPGEVLVSATVKDLAAGSGTVFVNRGVHVLKGVPGQWRLYAVAT